MIPVSNSGSLANKALTGARRNAGAGQASGFSLFYSDEETKYAEPGSPRLAEERAPIPAANAPGGAAPENRAVVRNRFHEYVEAHAVALAATIGAVFVLTVAPWLWLHARCDALSLNMVLLTASGAAGLCIVDCHAMLFAKQMRFGNAQFRVITTAAFGDVVKQRSDVQDPRFVPATCQG